VYHTGTIKHFIYAGYNYDSTVVRLPFDCLTHVTRSTRS